MVTPAPNDKSSRKTALIRWLWILYAVSLFLWLGVEDNAVLPVTLFGIAGTALAAVGWAHQRQHRNFGVLSSTAAGALTGVFAAPTTAALMLVKTGLHSHANPDYLPGQLIGMIERAPAWALAGALVGLGAWLVRKAFNAKAQKNRL